MKIFNGVEGCGKSLIIKEQVENLIQQGVAPYKILVLCLNQNKKQKFSEWFYSSSVSVMTFNELTNMIAKKNTGNLETRRISDFAAINLIHGITKVEFKKNAALKNLCKSNSFSRELYNLFGLFKVNSLCGEKLNEINEKCEISSEDKKRFSVILQVYKKYCEMLKNNNLTDYKDIVINSLSSLKENENLRRSVSEKFDYTFVESAQNLTDIQLELIKQFVDEDKLFLFGDTNAKIQTFMGANAFSPQKIESRISKCNQDILKRALFITGDFIESQKSESIEYNLFFDLQSEIDFIAKDIIEQVEKGAKYSDFAILIRDNSIRQNVSGLLERHGIPSTGEIVSEDFRLLKQKIIRLLSLFEIFDILGVEIFEARCFEKLKNVATTDKIFYFKALDMLIENVLKENLINLYSAEKLVSLKENEECLFETIFKHFEIFEAQDKNFVSVFLAEVKELYQLYKKCDFISIIVKIAKPHLCKDENFNRVLAKIISNLAEVTSLSELLGKNIIDSKSVLSLFEISEYEEKEDEDCVNLLTFFKAAGMEFDRVYIPNLVEGYFPKQAKSTCFISPDANEKLSFGIREYNKKFEKLIFSSQEEMKDEQNLMYTAMMTAKNKLFLSTHNYEGKKQILASSFFERLHFADEHNFSSHSQEYFEDEITSEEVVQEFKNVNSEPVLEEDEPFRLSPSSISTFLSCPRRFYLQRMLGLREKSTRSADYGTAVHAVFELVLKKYLNEFSKEKIIELADILLNVKNDLGTAQNAGFDEETIEDIQHQSDLVLSEMKEFFYAAIENLEQKGFFANEILGAECEIPFSFKIDEIKNVSFSGKIDAIIRVKDGYVIADYKTGRDKISPSTLFSFDGVNFLNKSGVNAGKFSETKMREYEYQLPLYFLASLYSSNLEEYKNKISKLGYVYIRPEFVKGSKEDFINAAGLDEYLPQIVENIKQYVVEELYKKSDFEPRKNVIKCDYCGFADICKEESGESVSNA